MKKRYIKPAVYCESITLKNILTSACSAVQPTEPLEIGGFSDDPEAEEDPVSKFLFFDAEMGCTTIITLNNVDTELGDNHYWCYQNPSDATRIFTS